MLGYKVNLAQLKADIEKADKRPFTATGYQLMSERTMNFGPYKLSDLDIKMLNCSMGIAGEAGELTDYLKKVIFHGHKVDTQKIAEEIGDLCWYLSAMCSLMGITFGSVLEGNVEKLKRRYPNGFDPEASQRRDDLPEGEE